MLQKIQRQSSFFHFAIVFLSCCCVFCFLYPAYKLFSFAVITLGFIHLLWAGLLWRIETIINTGYYVSFVGIALFPIILAGWHAGACCLILLYAIVPLMPVIYDPKLLLPSCIYVFVLSALVIFISTRLPHSFMQEQISEKDAASINCIVSAISFVFILLFGYYYSRILQIKTEPAETDAPAPKTEKKQAVSDEKEKRNKELYSQITNYLSASQAYKSHNFSLPILAKELNINTSYISEAVNTNAQCSFESLINRYRIDLVKKMLADGYAQKYTMEFIYTSAGYTNRSTFNENFKKMEGLTPSEYLVKLNMSISNKQ